MVFLLKLLTEQSWSKSGMSKVRMRRIGVENRRLGVRNSLRRTWNSLRVGPNLFDNTDQFHGKTVSPCTGRGWGDGFRWMIQGHHIYCVFYFYHYYIMIYNEIIVHHIHHNTEPNPELVILHLGGSI